MNSDTGYSVSSYLIISYVEDLVEPVVLVSVVTEHLLPRLEVIQGIDCHNGAKHRVRREQSVPGQCDYELLSFFGSVIGSVSSSRSHNVRLSVTAISCLELSFFIFLAQVSLRSLLGLSLAYFVVQTEPKILGLVY